MAAYRKRKPSARALNSGLGVQRLLMGGSSLSGMGGGGIHRLTMDPVQNTQTTSLRLSSVYAVKVTNRQRRRMNINKSSRQCTGTMGRNGD